MVLQRSMTLRSKLQSLGRKISEITTVRLGWHHPPYFLIIGVQKGGTSALGSYLKSHPQLIISIPPEVHFFDNNFEKGVHWYHSHFPMINLFSKKKIAYEKTPKYIWKESFGQRVSQYSRNLKFIIILRNPIERAFSSYNVKHWNWKERFSTFGEAIRFEIKNFEKIKQQDGLLIRGLYYQQLERFFRFIPKESLLILENNELRNDTLHVLNAVTKFLAIDEFQKVESVGSLNIGNYETGMELEDRVLLQSFYAEPNSKLFKMIGVEYEWN